eukprot:s165_g35.t1
MISASKGRHHAQEGVLMMLADDRWRHSSIDLEEACDDESFTRRGGAMHVLHSHGGKAKWCPIARLIRTGLSDDYKVVRPDASFTITNCHSLSFCKRMVTLALQLTAIQIVLTSGNFQLDRRPYLRTRASEVRISGRAHVNSHKVFQGFAEPGDRPQTARRPAEHTPARKRPAEGQYDEMDAIDENKKQRWAREIAIAFYERRKMMHMDYINRTDMILNDKNLEMEKLKHEQAILAEKLAGQEDYATVLSHHKDQAQQRAEDLRDKLDEDAKVRWENTKDELKQGKEARDEFKEKYESVMHREA